MLTDKLKLPAKISEVYTARIKLYDVFLCHPELKKVQVDIGGVTALFREILSCYTKRHRESPVFAEALHRSLENYLIGRPLTTTVTNRICNRLAGGIKSMSLGTPILPPIDQTVNGYCLAVIRNVFPSDIDCCGDFTIVFEVLTGEIAGDILEFGVKGPSLLRRFTRVCGLKSRGSPRDEKIHPRFLSGCFMFISPRDDDGYLFIKDMGTTGGLKSRGRKLYLDRTIHRRSFCDYEWPCTVCPVGLTDCHLATHPTHCVQGVCPKCGDNGEWLDPDAPNTASFDCQDTLWY